MKKTVLCLSLILLTGCTINSKTTITARLVKRSSTSEVFNAELNHCVDGDTAHFIVNGVEEKVRFLSIDTPEIAHDNNSISEPYGEAANDATCTLLMNSESILLEIDPNEDQRDQYDRLLAWVWIDDVLIQAQLIEIGYAEVAFVTKENLHSKDLYRLQELATKAHRGIWGN